MALPLPEVNNNLLAQLEAMGFTVPQAINALHFSGNTSVEAAIDWIIDHDNNEADNVDHTPQLVSLDIPIEGPTVPSQVFDQEERSEETERNRNLSEWKAKKEDERRAKDKMLQKLEQDKKERRERLTLPTESSVSIKSNNMLTIDHKKSLKLAESVRKVEAMEECLRSIRRQNMGNETGVRTAFQTLLVYVRNVANFPDNGRFRRIRLTNHVFQNRVGNFEGGIEFLELCGFVKVDSGELLFLPRDKVDMGLLKTACDLLHSAITNPYFGLLSRPPTRQAT